MKNALKKHLREKSHLFAYLCSCVFCARKEKRIEKRKLKKKRKVLTRQCTGLTKYVNVSSYIPTFTNLVSPGACTDLVSPF